MAAVIGLADDLVAAICVETGAFVANYNSPGQVVISGETAPLAKAMTLAAERGARKVVPLQVSGAFHTPLMEPAAEGLSKAISQVTWGKPSVPLVANTTAQPIDSASDIKRELTEQLTHSVKWRQSVEAMVMHGVDIFVEIGPGKVLAGLIKRISREANIVNIGDAASLTQFIEKGLVL
jgi:[acyl-carrier-protein] S-malonyltransferase